MWPTLRWRCPMSSGMSWSGCDRSGCPRTCEPPHRSLTGQSPRGRAIAVADDAPVIASYLLIGDFLRKALPSVGTETAYAAAEPLAERINAYPPAAVAVFFGEPQSSQQGRMQWQHRLMPVFLLLALLTWWRRPQNIHMVRQTRHR